jgi:cytidylate kinase
MAITTEQLSEAASIVSASPSVRAAAAAIRERFAPLKALVLDAFDMRDEQPAMQLDQRAIYLMSTDGHCWSVTAEPTKASAFVLTQN